jgi:hypothetical protein
MIAAYLVLRREDADFGREMHQAVAFAFGHIGAVRRVPRVNGEMRRAVNYWQRPTSPTRHHRRPIGGRSSFVGGNYSMTALSIDLEPGVAHVWPLAFRLVRLIDHGMPTSGRRPSSLFHGLSPNLPDIYPMRPGLPTGRIPLRNKTTLYPGVIAVHQGVTSHLYTSLIRWPGAVRDRNDQGWIR